MQDTNFLHELDLRWNSQYVLRYPRFIIDDWDFNLDDLYLAVTGIYLADISVRLYGLGWNSYNANGWNIFDIIVALGSLTTTFLVRAHGGGFVIEQFQKLFITSIAFKLVQRTNSLNKLFKTAV